MSYLGDRIDQMAMIQVLSIGATAAMMAHHTNMITFWATLPYVCMSPFVGALIDRYDRRRLMILMDVFRGSVVLVLPLIIGPGSHPYVIYLIIGLIGMSTSIFAPAKSAFIPEIVPGRHLLRANSVSATMGMLTLLFGTVIGGWMVAIFGYRPSLLIDAGTYFFSAVMLASVVVPRWEQAAIVRRERELRQEGTYFRNIKDGFSFILHNRIPAVCVLLDSWFFLVGGFLFTGINSIIDERLVPAAALTQQLAEKHSIVILANSYGSLGLGLAVGGVLTGRFASRVRLRYLLMACFLGAGICMALLTCVYVPVKAYLTLWALGFCAGGVVVVIETVLQKSVPDEVRGRVFALNTLLLNTTLLISIAAGTETMDKHWLGGSAALLVSAAAVVGGALVAWAGMPPDTTIVHLRPPHFVLPKEYKKDADA